MHIIVCIKSVVGGLSGGVARRTPENSELNPFDRPALEAALQLKEANGGKVTVLTMGPAIGTAVLNEARAMGVDRTILISDPSLAESDTLITSRVLACAVQRLGDYDLLFFGVRAADSDTGHVGPQTAAVLDVPFVSGVRQLTLTEDGADILRIMDDWQEQWQVALPAAVTIDVSAFDPRPVGLYGICDAYEQGTVEIWKTADLGLREEEVGLAGSPTRVDGLKRTRKKRSCEFLEGDPGQKVDGLMDRLQKIGVLDS